MLNRKIPLDVINEIPLPLQIEVPGRNPPAASIRTNCKARVKGFVKVGEGEILIELDPKDELLKSLLKKAIKRLVCEAPIKTNFLIKATTSGGYNPLGTAVVICLEALKALEKIHEEELKDNDRIDIVSSLLSHYTKKHVGLFKALCYTAIHSRASMYSDAEGLIEAHEGVKVDVKGVEGYVLAEPVNLPNNILDQLAKLSAVVLVELVFHLENKYIDSNILKVYNLIWAQTHDFEGELLKSLNKHRKMIVPCIDKYLFIITV